MDPLLIADDDGILLNVIGAALRRGGFEVVSASNGAEALARLERDSISLAVLSVDMPTVGGLDGWMQLRERSRVPMILLCEPRTERIALRGLEMGADDYLIKPFESRALVARVHAVLRRAGLSPTVSAGHAVLDREGLLFEAGGVRMQLSPLEAVLLGVLLSNVGAYVNAKTLMKQAWGQSGDRERNALKQVIYRLRRKLGDHATPPATLETSRARGYRLQIRPLEHAADAKRRHLTAAEHRR